MRLHILSDLHNEFARYSLPGDLDYDVLILAGDIDLEDAGVRWAVMSLKTPVVYIPGNHEYYSRTQNSIEAIDEKMERASSASDVHVLKPGVVEIGGWRFVGATLWTDFQLYGSSVLDIDRAMDCARNRMNDYRLIYLDGEEGSSRRFTPEDAVERFQAEKQFLVDELGRGDPSKTVVITHFSPSPLAVPDEFNGDELSPAFNSNLDDVIEASGVPLWVYGHSHRSMDFTIGQTRVLSNQRGYPREGRTGFNERLLVDVS
ncbi:MAG: metallophosphoesterase [Rhodospirillales bacterium]